MQLVIGILIGLVVATLPNYLTPPKEEPKVETTNCCEELQQLFPNGRETNDQLVIEPVFEDTNEEK